MYSDGDASHDLFIKGSASLDVANAGAGVEAAIKLGVPGFANISAGLRGMLMAQAGGTKLEAGVGINYNTADKKFKLDMTNENTFFKFDINASLRAKLNAFVHGKLFAFIDRDLVNISIADVNLGSVKFSGGAKLEQEDWVFDKSDFKVDTDFKELLLKNRVIKHTEKSNVQLGEMEKIISDPDNAALFGGELGEQEALDRSAEIQAAVLPMLEQLQKMHKDSSQKLGMMDEQYHRSTDEMWNKIEADRVSIAGANSVINDIYKRRDMAKKDPKKARAEAALRPVDFSAGLNGKDAPSALKIGELFFKGMETQSINATQDTVVRENTKPQTIYETFLPRAGFQPPTAILAAMSRKIYFKERGKGEELSAAMQRYVGIRQAINQVYENPNQSLVDCSDMPDIVVRGLLSPQSACVSRGEIALNCFIDPLEERTPLQLYGELFAGCFTPAEIKRAKYLRIMLQKLSNGIYRSFMEIYLDLGLLLEDMEQPMDIIGQAKALHERFKGITRIVISAAVLIAAAVVLCNILSHSSEQSVSGAYTPIDHIGTVSIGGENKGDIRDIHVSEAANES